MNDYDDIAERLEEVAAELDERSFVLLREAASKRAGRPADDKVLTQARRAVEKAIVLLRRAAIGEAQDEAGDGDDA